MKTTSIHCLFVASAIALLFSGRETMAQQDTTHPLTEESSLEFFGFSVVSRFTGNMDTLPYVEFSYGLTTVNREGFAEATDVMPSYRLRFGTEYRKYLTAANIMRTDKNGVSIEFLNANPFQGDATEGPKTRVSMWSLSFDNTSGYGYSLGGDAHLVLTHGGGGMWGWLDRQSMAISDTQHVVDFGRAMRYGERSTAGMQLRVSSAVSLDVNADWSLLYPRHQFLQWATSHLIEGIADGIASTLVRAAGSKSPGSLPILYFVLRNGIAAGFKQLRTRDMNWPFTSAPPLSMITYRVGFGVAF